MPACGLKCGKVQVKTMIKKEKNRLELLAPGGSFAGVKAALAAGADAVYMGGSHFSARAYAQSVTEEHSLETSMDYAHFHGKKLYLTLNTLLKQEEMEKELYQYVAPLYEQGVDAVLVQDLGVLSFLRREFPDLPLHASTQMTVTSAESAGLLKEMGLTRVVAARELNLKELERIYKETRMELEAFVHGAICYCYSGQCLYSGVIGQRSGNRGRCAQPCRLPYTAFDSKKKQLNKQNEPYLLSLKDMCTLEYLPRMAQAGVMSFKIEGRMKSPLYTAGVVSIYRKYLDLYEAEGGKNWKIDPEDRYALSQYFDRGGFTSRYLTAHNGRDMMALKEKKFRQPDPELVKKTQEAYLDKEWKEKVHVTAAVHTGECAVMTVTHLPSQTEVQVCSEEPVAWAQKRPLTEADVRKQLSKTGQTPFAIERFSCEVSADAFMPVQTMNQLRRAAFTNLEAAVLQKNRRKIKTPFAAQISSVESKPDEAEWNHRMKPDEAAFDYPVKADTDRTKNKDGAVMTVQLSNPAGLEEVLSSAVVDTVYLDSAGVEFSDLSGLSQRCHQKGKKVFLVLARIWREPAIEEWKRQYELVKHASLDGLVVGSLDALETLARMECRLPLVIDHTLYSWNREAKAAIAKITQQRKLKVLRLTAPLELNEKELHQRGCEDSEVLIYGCLPMMVTAGCIRKTTGYCNHKNERIWLKDRKSVSFPVACCCKYCYNVIYNSLPCSLLDKKEQIDALKPQAVRVAFTVETPQQIRLVLKNLEYGWGPKEMNTEKPEWKAGPITRGHFTRGVL